MGSIIHHPFAFTLGPITVTGFGIAMVLGFLIAQYTSEREMARRGYDPSPFGDITLGAVVGGIVGAKLYYMMLTGEFDLRTGFVFWGGLIGGLIGTWVVIRYKKLSYIRLSDHTAPGLAAAYAVGRTGCWAVGDDYGRPWNGPWAVSFPNGSPPSTADVMARDFHVTLPAGTQPDQVMAVHPTQLYEVGFALIMFAILWRMRDHKHAEGWLFGLYFVLAGLERFIVEFFRAKDDRFFGQLTMAQMFALGFVVVGAVLMQRRWTVGPGRAGIYAPS
jgi:phosphatidylglycerol:prolipoprotein diacylglycerol transferase